MNTASTRTVDTNGNVSYIIRRGDEVVGIIHKTCSGYTAEYPSGSWVPATSIKKARALLESR